MKKHKLLIIFTLFIALLTGCSNKDMFTVEDNDIKKVTIEEVEKETKKCLVIIGKKNDDYTEGLSDYLKTEVEIKNTKIYLVYFDDSADKINSIFSPKKFPTLYVVKNHKILDSIEYYNEEDLKGMNTVDEAKYKSKIWKKITEFVEKNTN